jgi:N6-L-threonylcarbamoyladenine synthase
MRILGIESSADEVSAAVVEDGTRMLSNVIASTIDLTTFYGGIVPEIVARNHVETILPVIEESLKTADVNWSDIDAIGVTYGPGLIGSLLIGVLTARTLAIAKNKPLYGVNHVQAHVYGAFIIQSKLTGYHLPPALPSFPLLALIVSGGHTQLVLFEDHFKYKVLGQTADDAVGEAFDKVAKTLGLPYPGGPSIAQIAARGNHKAIKLPLAKMSNPYDFSFSGLKTAVLRVAQSLSGHDYTFPSSKLPEVLSQAQKADLAASFQQAAIKSLLRALELAARQYGPSSVVIAGGVAANQELRAQADKLISKSVIYPDIKLCTDNAAMIASLAYFQAKHHLPETDPYSLEAEPDLAM